jgi:hypothetical protein
MAWQDRQQFEPQKRVHSPQLAAGSFNHSEVILLTVYHAWMNDILLKIAQHERKSVVNYFRSW